MAAVPQTAERIFLSEQNVLVTNARFVTWNHTYALSGITSVKTLVESANPLPGVIAILAGFVLLGYAYEKQTFAPAFYGAVAIGIAVLIFRSLRAAHHLIVCTASGEVKAISSKDGPFIARVLAAINDAIVARG